MPREWAPGPVPIGRQPELTRICDFLARSPNAPGAVVLTGPAGIGKTTVWRNVVRMAGRSCLVLSCRPASGEEGQAGSALDDLFGSGRPPSARGVLSTLRNLAGDRRLVLAIDDAQWLDRRSAEVLGFCVRRLEAEPVVVVVTLGGGAAVPFGLDTELAPGQLLRIRLDPLNQQAIREILGSRLGTELPRHLLRRLYEACGGNPRFAIECARALLDRGGTCPAHEPIPVPDGIAGPVRRRLRDVAAPALRVARLLAASSCPREEVIAAAYGGPQPWVAIDQAIDHGLITRGDGALSLTHPLLRPVLYGGMTLAQRRRVHRRLGLTAPGSAERAWHLALAADGPSDQGARSLDVAARHAAARGAPETAAALLEQAARLTPSTQPASRRDRMVQAADHYLRAGEFTRSRELIESALDGCPPGRPRAWLLVRLAAIRYHQNGWLLAEQTFRQAMAEAPDDAALCAWAEQEIALARLTAGDLPGASERAWAALRSAERVTGQRGDRLAAHSLARVAAFDFLRGQPVRAGLLSRAEALHASGDEEPVERIALFGPPLVRAAMLKWCDRLDEASQRFAGCYRAAVQRGDEASLPFLLYHFSELECWAGNWTAAEEHAREGCRLAGDNHQPAMRAATLYALALVQAHRGQVDQARAGAAEALTLCERTGNVPVTTSLLSVLGFIELSLGDYQAAHGHLGRLAGTVARVGLGEPGVVRFLPDAIEALTALGETGPAWEYTLKLQDQAQSRNRRWALAAVARCRAQLASAEGDHETAQTACKEALAGQALLAMPFELARTLFVRGMIERRARCKAAAAESFTEALSVFERLGAMLWAARARDELSRSPARPLTDALTETERRVAALIAKGLTNRQIAAAMFVTQNTVQTHVRHIFLKVGVRSRTELAAHLLSARPGSTPLRRTVTKRLRETISGMPAPH
jgi:DNA-binding NarL/FixJ family response regulator